jgi:hypothetical protein
MMRFFAHVCFMAAATSLFTASWLSENIFFMPDYEWCWFLVVVLILFKGFDFIKGDRQ